MALGRLIAGVQHLAGCPVDDQGGVLLGIGWARQHLDQAAMAMAVSRCQGRNGDGMAAVMGSRGRLGHAGGQK